VTVWSDKVAQPVAVRYSFRNFAPGNLKNVFGIPAVPFRTDDWNDVK
jgi:sialate O-acetylesterase